MHARSIPSVTLYIRIGTTKATAATSGSTVANIKTTEFTASISMRATSAGGRPWALNSTLRPLHA
jgi:hypothetical protein